MNMEVQVLTLPRQQLIYMYFINFHILHARKHHKKQDVVMDHRIRRISNLKKFRAQTTLQKMNNNNLRMDFLNLREKMRSLLS
jgi:hypothetical protein